MELDLTRDGVQWVINGYILALAAGFALGGRLADVLGSPAIVMGTNRAINASYGEVTGITQTVRNYGSALGAAQHGPQHREAVVIGMAIVLVFSLIVSLLHPGGRVTEEKVEVENQPQPAPEPS